MSETSASATPDFVGPPVPPDLPNTNDIAIIPEQIDLTDAHQVLGIDALQGIWQENVAPFLDKFDNYLPFFIAAAVLVVVYTLFFWGLKKLIDKIINRLFSASDKQKRWRSYSHIFLRLTNLMVCAVTVFALMPFAQNYTGAIFRVYALSVFIALLWNLSRHLIKSLSRKKNLDESITLLLNNVSNIVLILIGVYLAFRQFGVNLLPILGGLGVLGLAVGFAAQDILANFISGITLLIDRPFAIGDWIRADSYEGRVKGLTLRTTRIRTRNNEHVSIPNKDLAGSTVINLTRGGPLRIDAPIGVAYKTDIDQARAVLMQVVEQFEEIITRPAPVIAVESLGDSSVNLLIRFWIDAEEIAQYPALRMRLLEAAKKALDKAGIEIPFPHLQLHIDGAKALRPWQPQP
ncbi:mechanosensitive ion channel family protein [Suttonella ornithocola]|uniref:Small-conductance mechanosensitive channel n=1 Tax=Suttonella ornithocola TaxID=279832 RepID=A0A380MQF7_9GAMM|nr:mechanosensitive ion channel family protein [Suttonella ornithocola]SUO94849.1 Small-conductance mechanosensitive channel [Suttonella ornithocola]